ncbi:MAG: hypothetical protein H6559_34475 [Lewinellaceae bacterium]|nr:hypothetical protein [Lewinellaceae bacterium]
MVEEIQRVLKPDGMALITFPPGFPFTYDPINRLLSYFTDKKISQGAYAFGHDYLVSKKDFRYLGGKEPFPGSSGAEPEWLPRRAAGDVLDGDHPKHFKTNATNLSDRKEKKLVLHTIQQSVPFLTVFTDWIIKVDDALSAVPQAPSEKASLSRKTDKPAFL